MYKVSSDRRQVTLHRGRPSDWVNGEERQSPEERLRQAKEAIAIYEDRIKAALGEEKARLGREKFQIQCELIELKKLVGLEKTAGRSLAEFFMDAAREELSKFQFALLTKFANEKANAAKSQYESAEQRASDNLT